MNPDEAIERLYDLHPGTAPVEKSAEAFVPIFQIRIHAKLRGGSS